MNRTIREACLEAIGRIERVGSDAPGREARELIRSALGLEARDFLLLDFSALLDPRAEPRLEAMLARREAHEPLQYLLGTVPFCDLELEVGPGVLIPRPETEVLVERLDFWLTRFAESGSADLPAPDRPGTSPPNAPGPASTGPAGRGPAGQGPAGQGPAGQDPAGQDPAGQDLTPWMIDVGTGTGAILLALLARSPRWKGIGIDHSSEALGFARRNLARAIRGGHPYLAGRVRLLQSDLLDCVGAAGPPGTLGLIVSNPPYIPTPDIGQLAPEVRDHEPRTALDGGTDGLVFVRRITEGAARLLRSGGLLAFELAWDQPDTVATLLEGLGFEVLERYRDLAGRSRGVIAQRL